jgi:amino acid transporter
MSALLAVVIVVCAPTLAVILLAAVRRRVTRPLLAEPTRGTPMITIVGTAFAVLLAFITLAAFQTYNGAKSGAQSEAVAVLDMFKTAALFPAPQRVELRSDFVCYARAVTDQEWPAMRRGDRAPLVDAWVSAYRDAIRRLDVRSPRQRLGFQDLLASARDRTNGRRDRLSDATPTVPLPLWLGLIVAGCIAVLIQLAMADPRERMLVQAGMTAGVAAIVAIGLLFVNFLDHPYHHGPGSIQPIEMRTTMTMMREQDPALRPSCRSDGGFLAPVG